MKKSISLLFMIALVCSVFGVTAAASPDVSITLEAGYDAGSGTVAVHGRISSGSGQEVSVKIAYPNSNIYVNQITSGEEGDYALSYRLAEDEPGIYHVYAGGAGIAAPVHKQFTVESGSNDGDHGQGGNGAATGDPAVSVKDGEVRIASEADGKIGKAKLDPAGWDALDKSDIKKKQTLVIAVDAVVSAESIHLELPAKIMKDAESLGVKRLEIRTQFVTVVLATDAIPAAGDESDKLEFSVTKLDSAGQPDTLTGELKGKTAYDFGMMLDGQPVHVFNGKKAVQVSVPYAILPEENPSRIVVYNVSGDGSPEIVKNGRYSGQTGLVTFYAQHFSIYAVGEHKIAFNDLDTVKWAEDSINSLAAREIIIGTGGGRFLPQHNLTRGEFVKMLMSGLELTDQRHTMAFKDVPAESWYNHEASSAAQLGIVNGYADGTFGGGNPLTREEMFVMAARALRAAEIEPPHIRGHEDWLDLAQISDYARNDTVELFEMGLIEGDGSGNVLPREGATRAEAAVFLQRLLGLYEQD